VYGYIYIEQNEKEELDCGTRVKHLISEDTKIRRQFKCVAEASDCLRSLLYTHNVASSYLFVFCFKDYIMDENNYLC